MVEMLGYLPPIACVMHFWFKLRIVRISRMRVSIGVHGTKENKNPFRAIREIRSLEVLNELMGAPDPKRKPIGFSVKERRARYSVRSTRHS